VRGRMDGRSEAPGAEFASLHPRRMKNDGASSARRHVLTLNAGSSSLKLGVFTAVTPPRKLLSATISRIGLPGAMMTIVEGAASEATHILDVPDHARALALVLDHLGPRHGLAGAAAVGHRVVHGGPRYDSSRQTTPEVLAELRRLCALDADHLPAEIAIIEAMTRLDPALPQVACFDTAFHSDMPRVARLLAIPRRYEAQGVRRYGFHGLSYTFLVEELQRVAGAEAARGRVVLAHLGSGASLCAVREGRSVDTTMGFTPTSGIPMGTRSGDLDPGVLLYLLRVEGFSVAALDDLCNRRSGLYGLSGSSPDMRDLLDREAEDPAAADAVALFCQSAKKAIGALAATLGGLDTLVFSGGIGERSPSIRARISRSLEHLGVVIDDARNEAGAPVVSTDEGRCTVRVLRTDEESILARETLAVLGGSTPSSGGPPRSAPSRGGRA
jgi:acetate kinase